MTSQTSYHIINKLTFRELRITPTIQGVLLPEKFENILIYGRLLIISN